MQDKDDDRWEEYQDRTTGLYFYCCPVLMKSSFHPPDLPPPTADESNSKVSFAVTITWEFFQDCVSWFNVRFALIFRSYEQRVA